MESFKVYRSVNDGKVYRDETFEIKSYPSKKMIKVKVLEILRKGIIYAGEELWELEVMKV